MRDKKDNATFDLPGFGPAAPMESMEPIAPEIKRPSGPRPKRSTLKQVQLELLEATDNSGLPPWVRDEGLDLTGLPVWAPN